MANCLSEKEYLFMLDITSARAEFRESFIGLIISLSLATFATLVLEHFRISLPPPTVPGDC